MTTNWIDALRTACEARSQREVADLIGYSQTVVCKVLKDTYPRNTDRIRTAVERVLMRGKVDCPVLGSITRQHCMDMQRRPFSATNPQTVKLYRACRSGCPHSSLPQTIFPLDASAPQPAVGSNTGSPGAAPTNSCRVTEPTCRRKRLNLGENT